MIWKEKEAEFYYQTYLYLLFSSNVSVLPEKYQIRCSEVAGKIKNSQRAVDFCKCGPLNVPALKVFTGQLVKIKALEERNEC